jgi:hypothetical protein
MQVVASGANVGKGRWHATGVRDFALEAGRFLVARRVVHVPAPVVVRVVAVAAIGLVPRAFLDAAATALTRFSKRYGAYPWRAYTVVVEADRRSLGVEYPTLVFVSPDVPPQAVTHETGHQWFYSLVGDNQARTPWLDESLTEWATARAWDDVAIEAAPDMPAKVPNQLGQPMTFWGRLPFLPDVWDGLYMQGVKAFASFGDDDAVDCALQRYVHDNAYRTAQPRDLLNALTPIFPTAEAILAGFGARFLTGSTARYCQATRSTSTTRCLSPTTPPARVTGSPTLAAIAVQARGSECRRSPHARESASILAPSAWWMTRHKRHEAGCSH